MLDLQKQLLGMAEAGTLETPDGFPAAFTLIPAMILLLVGISAIVGTLLRVGRSSEARPRRAQHPPLAPWPRSVRQWHCGGGGARCRPGLAIS